MKPSPKPTEWIYPSLLKVVPYPFNSLHLSLHPTSPGNHQCFLSLQVFAFSRILYEWNHKIFTFFFGLASFIPYYVLRFIQSLCVSTAHFFLSLNSILLHRYNRNLFICLLWMAIEIVSGLCGGWFTMTNKAAINICV